jgi:hypothetical protein
VRADTIIQPGPGFFDDSLDLIRPVIASLKLMDMGGPDGSDTVATIVVDADDKTIGIELTIGDVESLIAALHGIEQAWYDDASAVNGQ